MSELKEKKGLKQNHRSTLCKKHLEEGCYFNGRCNFIHIDLEVLYVNVREKLNPDDKLTSLNFLKTLAESGDQKKTSRFVPELEI